MNILLINPPIREKAPPYYQPIGLAIVAKILQNSGHYVELFDINCLRYSRKEVAKNLPRPYDKFELIGVGGLITTYEYMNFLLPLLREKYRNVPIMIGGGGITSSPQVFMNNLRADFGIIGEGEHTVLELVSCLEMNTSCNNILGLAYFENNELKLNPPRPLERNLDSFPMQAFSLLDMETYTRNVRHNSRAKREVIMTATRGCPFDCTFCYHVFGRGVRYRSVDNVIAEMEYLIDKHKVDSFVFGDECFTARKSYIHEFCNEVLKRKLDIEWSAFSRINTIDEETMSIMSEAGCFVVGFGLESGSQRILKEMDKKVTVEQMKDTFLAAKRHFRKVSGTFIYGMPGENDESIDETISFCKSIDYYKRFFYLAPYPGTKVYRDNLDRILEKYGSEHNFFMVLGDATDFVINLTGFPDDVFLQKKVEMEMRIKEYLGIQEPASEPLSLVARVIRSIRNNGIRYTANKIVTKMTNILGSRQSFTDKGTK